MEYVYVFGGLGVNLQDVVDKLVLKKYHEYTVISPDKLIKEQITDGYPTTIKSWPPNCVFY